MCVLLWLQLGRGTPSFLLKARMQGWAVVLGMGMLKVRDQGRVGALGGREE